MSIIPVAYLATTEELTLIANEYREEAIIKLTQNGSNKTGRLVNSIKVQPARVTETSIVIPVTMLYYGEFLDKGVIGTKSGISLAGYKFKSKAISPLSKLPLPVRIAIAQRGIRPVNFIQSALNSVQQQYITSGKLSIAVAIDLNNNIQINANNTPGLNGN
jgi:hypothetical protein